MTPNPVSHAIEYPCWLNRNLKMIDNCPHVPVLLLIKSIRLLSIWYNDSWHQAFATSKINSRLVFASVYENVQIHSTHIICPLMPTVCERTIQGLEFALVMMRLQGHASCFDSSLDHKYLSGFVICSVEEKNTKVIIAISCRCFRRW